jgi:hypothetical protein
VSIVENFNEAMQLWFDLTGLDPNAKKWTMAQYGIQRMNDAMLESMKLDDTLITTYLLLDAYSTAYFKEAKVSVHEFDEDEDKVFDYMDKVRKFRKLIRSPEITGIAIEFTEKLRQALVSYGVEATVINKFLDQKDLVAYIRRDALKSADRLRRNQFMKGDTDPAEVRPAYNSKVFGYWNINSLIEDACRMPSGISLNLIRNPNELHSYFTFSIRNGANVIVLTDFEDYGHPLARSMRRRADRDFDDRVDKNRFPYQLLQIAFDDKGNAYHDKWRESAEKGLVTHHDHHFELEDIAKLSPGQIVWTTLMFDLIKERFWHQPIPQMALSYTNAMIRLDDRDRMLSAAARANLPVAGYQPLDLPRLSIDDVRTGVIDPKVLTASQSYIERHGRNRWMEERYGHLVPEEALNLVGVAMLKGKGETLFLESEEKTNNYHGSFGSGEVTEYTGDPRIKSGREDHWGGLKTRAERTYRLEAVDGELFGTAAELDADRKFIARFNFARGIQKEADAEYHREKAAMAEWYRKAIMKRIDFLLSFAAMEDRLERHYESDGFSSGTFRYTFAGLVDDNEKDAEKRKYGPFANHWPQVNISHEDDAKGAWPKHCLLTGAKSNMTLHFKPSKIEDVLLLTGLSLDGLPYLLQHWNPHSTYVGNSILNRIDPMEWKLENPWSKFDFGVRIFLSRRAVNRIKKEMTPPDATDAPLPATEGRNTEEDEI